MISAHLQLQCHKCGNRDKVSLSKSFTHIKASCAECGNYIKFVSPKLLKNLGEQIERLIGQLPTSEESNGESEVR